MEEEGSAFESAWVLSSRFSRGAAFPQTVGKKNTNGHFNFPLDTNVSTCVNNKWQLTDRG